MSSLIADLLACVRGGHPAAYAALVETRGSTPQKAGAVMIVYGDGSQSGTLGGGCVEAEVKRRALALLDGGTTELMTFQLDNDYGWDDGLICGGRMKMLVDPLRPGMDLSFYERLLTLAAGEGGTDAVVIDAEKAGPPEAARWLLNADGSVAAASRGADEPGTAVREQLRPVAERPRPYVAGGVSFLPHLPRCRLVIVGAGHVGQKVAELAADADFDVWVIDDRADYCSAERFPRAQRRIAGSIVDTLSTLETDSHTFAIIVTRGHNHDEEALFHLATKPGRYLGMIGSRRKIKLIFDDLRREGISDAALARVQAPLGFDIGSQTVPEIAISIVAELIACRNLGRVDGQIVRDRQRVG